MLTNTPWALPELDTWKTYQRAFSHRSNHDITGDTVYACGVNMPTQPDRFEYRRLFHTVMYEGTRYDVTGLSASITPSSSSNKVLVHSSINFNNAAGEGFKGYLVRGSTDIGVSTAASSSTATFPLGTMANTNNYWLNTTGGFVLDTPSTTSATTYKIQMEVLSTTYTIFINKPARNTSGDVAVPSFITLFEVAA